MDKPKRLGRGLSSLLSTNVPVQVDITSDNHAHTGVGRSVETAAPTSVDNGNAGMPRKLEPDSTTVETHGTWEIVTTPRPSASAASALASGGGAGGLSQVLVADIGPNRFQPRRSIDDASVSQLAASIRTSGLMQPVIVRPMPANSGRAGVGVKWELVAGERRWRAAIEAGLRAIPAIVRELSDKECAEWAVVENVQREDLNPIDKGLALKALSDQFKMTQGEIAERMGLERSTVANLVRLVELEPVIQDMVAKGDLSAGHAKILLSMASQPGVKIEERGRVLMAARAAAAGWSVRALDSEIRKWEALQKARPEKAVGDTPIDPAVPGTKTGVILADLAKRIGQHLGTKVKIQPRAGAKGKTAGRIIIDYYDLDHFDSLMDRIGK